MPPGPIVEMRARSQPSRTYLLPDCAHAYLLIGIFGIANLVATLSEPGSPPRWGIYGMPVVSLVLAAVLSLGSRLSYDRFCLYGLLIYALAALIASEASGYIGFHSIRDVLIASGVFITFIPWFKVDDRVVKLLCICFIVALGAEYLVHHAQDADPHWDSQQADSLGEVSFLQSKGLLKSTTAFPLGVIAYYFYKRSEWLWMSVTVVSQFIGFRRISLIALFAVIVVDMLMTRAIAVFGSRRSRRWYGAILIVTIAVLFAASLYFNALVALFNDAFDLRLSLNAFTEGRYELNEAVEQVLGLQSLSHWIFGHGIGFGDVLALEVTGGGTTNLHNDFMKLCLDYGLLGTVLVLLAYNIPYIRSVPAATNIIIYNCFLYVTDNTLIYYYHIFSCFLVARALTSWSSSPPRRLQARAAMTDAPSAAAEDRVPSLRRR